MNCGGFFLAADFLYWRAENHGFSYAYEQKTTSPVGLNVGSVLRMNPDWDPAFRVGLGWNTRYDFWDVFLNYTWYRNHSSETRTSANGFFPLWPLSNVQQATFSSVNANSRFTMNMGDLEVGRMLFLTRTLAIRPHVGAEGGSIHERFYDSFSDLIVGGAHSGQRFSGKNNWWGVGPRAGVNTEFHLSCGFSLKGNLAGALLYGKNQARSQNETLQVGATAFAIEREYEDDYYQLVPHLQLALGFQWQTCFLCEKMLYRMSVLWETNYWWNQFNLPVGLEGFLPPLPTIGNQPLTMEGLTVNLEWGF
ncbi:MAG: hypothetical protein A3D96_06765 [Chlamydiae bacterium RIFCSPHIGHO2_12_FULL_44_59]|nr:MAG: hypothetical protein A3D96_06765 [Chlamydiae bacterium RIFCSPHIGHO2_12_FULL_44_59]OGN69597.1 MAG: hypothetical protein A3F79_07355 [Chlamydiae bacterium RIFCSPLOWO2_12_FULL_45_20]